MGKLLREETPHLTPTWCHKKKDSTLHMLCNAATHESCCTNIWQHARLGSYATQVQRQQCQAGMVRHVTRLPLFHSMVQPLSLSLCTPWVRGRQPM